jgi:hypothetical protein
VIIVLPFFPQYLAKPSGSYLFYDLSSVSKPTLMISSSFMYGLNHERRMMDKILYEVNNSDMPQ